MSSIFLQFVLPFSYVCSTRVSNELGAGHPQTARLAVRVVLVLVVVEGLIMGSAVIMFRKKWGEIYSTETQVIRYVASMMPIIAISSFLDGIQSVLSGFFFVIHY